MLATIFLVFALVLFILAAVLNPQPPRVNLIAAGLAFVAAAMLLPALR